MQRSILTSLSHANTITKANYVRDTCGNKGAGVKIGIIEGDVPKKSDSFLKNADITVRSGDSTGTHATYIARILVGTDESGSADGFAPAAKLYCASQEHEGEADFYGPVKWLISRE